MNKQISNFSRRKFVGFGIASALAPSVVRGESPNGKLNMGIIGSGGRGGANLNGVKAENIHTLCDINRKTLEAVQKRFKGAKTTTDWREVVSNPEIDAVVISTADHHHAPAAIAAMRAGKHVYCEKPLAHTVQELVGCRRNMQKQRGRLRLKWNANSCRGELSSRRGINPSRGDWSGERSACLVQPEH